MSNTRELRTVSENTEEANTISGKGTRRLRKKNYEKINDEIRKKIIFEVTVLGNKLKTICEKLNINVSSAKNVLAIYKKEGRIEKKKYRVKRKNKEDSDGVPEQTQASSEKTSTTPHSNFPNYPQTAPAMGSTSVSMQNPLNLNDMGLSLLFENYCMCTGGNQNSDYNPLTSMEEYFKTVNQLIMNNYSKCFNMGMMSNVPNTY